MVHPYFTKTTPTEKLAHTFTAFAEALSTMRRSREARQRRASMLVYNNTVHKLQYIILLIPKGLEGCVIEVLTVPINYRQLLH